MKSVISKRVISLILSIVMVLSLVPAGVVRTTAAVAGIDSQIVDDHTLDQWKQYFGVQTNDPNNVSLTTEYAGGVWTDKSVFDPSDIPSQLTGATYNGNGIRIADEGDNFLVSLSAIASNKEVVGYSTRPTDTMLVLDLSGSMSGSVSDMVTAANKAIGDLLALNNYNRVGVVLFSGNSSFGNSNTSTATLLMPLDRYTTTSRTSSGAPQYITSNNSEQVSVARGVSPRAELGSAKNTVGGTYTQNGIYIAMNELVNATDKVIPEGSIQAGTIRLPIMVLMSDGEPSVATKNYTKVGTSDVGEGRTDTTYADDMAFLTQLTMAYAKREVDTAYGTDSLLYTLGYSVGGNNYAQSVLDPAHYTTNRINSLWTTFNNTAAGRTFSINAMQNQNKTVTKHTDQAGKYAVELKDYRNYTDAYFSATRASDLYNAFQSIVDEIVIQARYYPTYVEKDHDHDGYLTFVDKIGSYMEVSDVKGIVVGNRLFSGAALAAKFVDGSFGTMNNPTETGTELIQSIMTRLNIDDMAVTKALAVSAYSHGQLAYTNDQNFSHYIGWFSDADGNYVDFWHEGMTDTQIAEVVSKKGATHIIKSYIFLGDTSVVPGVNNTDMMYMSVRAAREIATGEMILTWRVPASLVPTITYQVGVRTDEDGKIEELMSLNLEQGTANAPIRLLYEVGLRSDITDWNMAEKVSASYVQSNGYTFWSNKWSSDPEDTSLNTYSHFEPSVQNERYYYTQDTTVLSPSGSGYAPYTGSKPSGSGYYRSYDVYEKLENGTTRIHTHYEPISAEAMASVKADGDGWVIPMGTIHRYYDYEIAEKVSNPTNTMGHSDHPFVVKNGDIYYTYSTQGNNGKFTTAPATGIKLTKSLAEGFASDAAFTFAITGSIDGAQVVRLNSDGTEKSRSALAASGEVTLTAGETVYVVGLTAGSYTVTEKIPVDADYHVQSVQVAGQTVSGSSAQLTLVAQKITAVEFINAEQGYGNLVISKDVNYPAGFMPTDAHNAKTFTVDVTFTGDIASVTAPDGAVVNGNTYTLTLRDGQSATFSGIKHGVAYTVAERNVPAGYSLTEVRYSNADKAIRSATTDEAHVINAYAPAATNGDLVIRGTKTVTGGWPENAGFTLRLWEVTDFSSGEVIDTKLIDTVTAGDAAYEIDMSSITFDAVGTYNFRVVEDIPENRIPDMAYDRTYGLFSVTVTDSDADGKLEIASVQRYQNTGLTGSGEDGWVITKDFTNVVTKDIVYLDIRKTVVDAADPNKTYTDHLADITFGLFDSMNSQDPSYYILTDGEGKGTITVPVTRDSLGAEGKVFYLREIAPAVENRVVGMTYDESWIYAVRITWDAENNVAVAEYAVMENGIVGEFAAFDDAMVFAHTNTYEANVQSTSEIQLSGTKTLNGGNDLGGRSFRFSIYNSTAAYVIQGQPLQTVSNNGNAITFDGIRYGAPGLHYLVVKEEATTLGGVAIDPAEYHITVLVEKYSDANGTTRLRVAQGYPTIVRYGASGAVSGDALNFNNTYTVTGSTTATIEGTKTLTGRPMLNGEFKFRLTEVADEAGTAMENALVLEAENGPANGSAAFRFEPITYTQEGTHYYKITEIAGASDVGVTYSADSFVVKVVVSDNGEGGLVAAQTVVDGRPITFANSYKPSGTYTDVFASKELEGKTLADGQFEFILMETEEDFVTPLQNGVTKTVKNGEHGVIDFGRLFYETEGYHYYCIREIVPDEPQPGITYDRTEYHITIQVVDNRLGKLGIFTSIEMVTLDENDQTVTVPTEAIVFHNSYDITGEAGVRIEGTKILTGRKLEDGEFTFELYKTDENYSVEGVVPVTAVNEGDAFSFVLNYEPEDAGQKFYYVLQEKNRGKTIDGVTYSDAQYKIEIEVRDNDQGGLEAVATANGLSVSNVNNVTILSGADFENAYGAPDTDVVLTVKKTMTGHSNDPSGFTFGLFEGDDEEPLRTVTSDADGVVSFPALVATMDHVQEEPYVFYVKEILPEGTISGVKDGYTYDTTVYKVELTVSEDGMGNLVTSYTVDGEDVDEETYQFAFVNSYKKPSSTPETGDDSNVALWMAMLLLSAGALAVMMVSDKKRKKA